MSRGGTLAKRGKTIQVFLIDGEPKGRIKCTLANWTGVAYKIPRTRVEQSKDIKLLSQTGVYFLFGKAEESDEDIVYIGQAGARKNNEGVLNRIAEHKRSSEKDYWTEAVIFTTANNSFGPTEISYLENRFYALACKNNRLQVKNNMEPTPGNVTEEKESELEEFIDYAKIIIGTLGYNLFEPLLPSSRAVEEPEKAPDELLLFLKRMSRKSNQLIEAQCKQTAEGFVVLRGSQVEVIDSIAIPASIKMMRQKADINENGILQEEVLFKSPSYAASFILGMNTNGKTDWKTVEGKTLSSLDKEIQV